MAPAECTREETVGNIDIGGLRMVRSAAKNHKDVSIVVNSADSSVIGAEIHHHSGSLTLETRFNIAIKDTAAYDSMIANYFGSQVPVYHGDAKQPSSRFPCTLNLDFIKKQDMRHGENSHQLAAFYTVHETPEAAVAITQQSQGKALSYDNIDAYRCGDRMPKNLYRCGLRYCQACQPVRPSYRRYTTGFL